MKYVRTYLPKRDEKQKARIRERIAFLFCDNGAGCMGRSCTITADRLDPLYRTDLTILRYRRLLQAQRIYGSKDGVPIGRKPGYPAIAFGQLVQRSGTIQLATAFIRSHRTPQLQNGLVVSKMFTTYSAW